jgi:hypothetical protein
VRTPEGFVFSSLDLSGVKSGLGYDKGGRKVTMKLVVHRLPDIYPSQSS